MTDMPHFLIVDTNGTIVFRGHPAKRVDLVEDFDKLLAGEKLEGDLGTERPVEATAGSGLKEEEAKNAINKFWT